MSEQKWFRIMTTDDRSSGARIVGALVPWGLVASHEGQAKANHYQTLERLNERGGLSYCEMLAVLEDRAYSHMPIHIARDQVFALVAKFNGLVTVPRDPTEAQMEAARLAFTRSGWFLSDDGYRVAYLAMVQAGDVSA